VQCFQLAQSRLSQIRCTMRVCGGCQKRFRSAPHRLCLRPRKRNRARRHGCPDRCTRSSPCCSMSDCHRARHCGSDAAAGADSRSVGNARLRPSRQTRRPSAAERRSHAKHPCGGVRLTAVSTRCFKRRHATRLPRRRQRYKRSTLVQRSSPFRVELRLPKGRTLSIID
jgi:hypothetical protein